MRILRPIVSTVIVGRIADASPWPRRLQFGVGVSIQTPPPIKIDIPVVEPEPEPSTTAPSLAPTPGMTVVQTGVPTYQTAAPTNAPVTSTPSQAPIKVIQPTRAPTTTQRPSSAPVTAQPTEIAGVDDAEDFLSADPGGFGSGVVNTTAKVEKEYMFYFKMYTASSEQVEAAVEQTGTASLKHLHQFFKAESDAVRFERIQSKVLRSCDSVSDPIPFPDHLVCNLVGAVVYASVDDTQVDLDSVEESVLNEVRINFVNAFHDDQDDARLYFEYLIQVSAGLQIELSGVDEKMDLDDAGVFLQSVRTQIDEIFQTTVDPIDFGLEDVTIKWQETSSDAGHTRRSLQQRFNRVFVVFDASCTNKPVCTDESLQTVLNARGPAYSKQILDSLEVTAEANERIYFDGVQSVRIFGVEEDRPGVTASPNNIQIIDLTDGDDENEGKGRARRIPRWVVIMLLVDAVIVSLIVIYILQRRLKRRKQGEQLQDPEEITAPHTIKGSLASFVSPVLAFRGENADEPMTIDQLQEMEYDQQSDEFSVEAADFSVAEEDDVRFDHFRSYSYR